MLGRTNRRYLTKTDYVKGSECKKFLWLRFNDPESLPKLEDPTLMRLEEGNEVGNLAKRVFPNGIEVEEQLDHKRSAEETISLMRQRKPLFEAGFIDRGGRLYARVDILVPSGQNSWDIYEVKSSTSVKKEHIPDVSFQKYCLQTLGIDIRGTYIMHLNGNYVRKGAIEPKNIFTQTEISPRIREEVRRVPNRVQEMINIISQRTCPEINRSDLCCFPQNEAFEKTHSKDRFFLAHPNVDVLNLYGKKRVAIDAFRRGTYRLKDMNPELLDEKQIVQQKAHREGKAHVDRDKIREFLSSLKYPLHFIDFETYSTAIPRFDGARPHEQIPFQFSLHKVINDGENPIHISFLGSGEPDPRKEFVRSLEENVDSRGSIIVYNTFERTILNELSSKFPLERDFLSSAISRISDLLQPFRGFAYYHPAQKGSASIKAVLPVLTDRSYDGFSIRSGNSASFAYMKLIDKRREGIRDEETVKIRRDLEEYCGQDTFGMVLLVNELRKLAK